MKTERIHHWQSALSKPVQERWHQPFAWGVQDCFLWAADCVLTVTGEDVASTERGAYNDARSAARLVEELGGVAAIGASRFGAEVPVASAQVGDVVLVRFDGRDTLAVCMGMHALGPGELGLVSVSMDDALKVWRCTKD